VPRFHCIHSEFFISPFNNNSCNCCDLLAACKAPNEDSDLPLHLAFQNDASVTTIERLLSVHPDSVRIVGSEDQLPRDMAAENGFDMGIIDPLLSGTKSDTISSTESESSAL
jgi:hypothetical protein